MLAFWFLCWIFGLVLAGSFWSASSVHFNVYCSIRSNTFSVNRSDCCSSSSNSFEAGWWWLRGFFCSRLVLADLEKFTNCGSGLPPLRIFFLRKKHFFSYIRIFCARHVHSSTNIIVWRISALSIALGINLNQTLRACFLSLADDSCRLNSGLFSLLLWLLFTVFAFSRDFSMLFLSCDAVGLIFTIAVYLNFQS